MSRAPIEMMLDGIQWKRIELPPPHERTTGLPVATHEGALEIAGLKLRAYQLSDGQRVFDADDVEAFFTEMTR